MIEKWLHFFIIHSFNITCRFISFLPFKIQFHRVPPLHCVLFCKIHIYMLKMTATLSRLLTKISFFYKKFANFWFDNMFCSQFDINLALIPWIVKSSKKLQFSIVFKITCFLLCFCSFNQEALSFLQIRVCCCSHMSQSWEVSLPYVLLQCITHISRYGLQQNYQRFGIIIVKGSAFMTGFMT